MVQVIPLKYGRVFKRVFSDPAVFRQFVADVLGITINVDQIHTEYEYPISVGFVKSRYDLFAEDIEQRIVVEIQQIKEEDFFDRFLYYHMISMIEQVQGYEDYWFNRVVYTIVVLTSVPQDGSVNFSYAVSDFSPVDEFERKISVYPHRLIFLVPRKISDKTPPKIRKWLEFILDSLDGKMDEADYSEPLFCGMLDKMRRSTTSPEELAEIRDEIAWEQAKQRFAAEGWDEGRADGLAEGLAEGLEKGKTEGLAAGIEKGRLEGEIAVLRRLLTRRFGELPEWVQSKLAQATESELELWSSRVLETAVLDGVFAEVRESS